MSSPHTHREKSFDCLTNQETIGLLRSTCHAVKMNGFYLILVPVTINPFPHWIKK